jgi:putative transposase
LSTGEQIENPRFLRQSEDDLAKAQQRLSTKKRGSGKRRKQKKIVSRIHRKIQNQRKEITCFAMSFSLSSFNIVVM